MPRRSTRTAAQTASTAISTQLRGRGRGRGRGQQRGRGRGRAGARPRVPRSTTRARIENTIVPRAIRGGRFVVRTTAAAPTELRPADVQIDREENDVYNRIAGAIGAFTDHFAATMEEEVFEIREAGQQRGMDYQMSLLLSKLRNLKPGYLIRSTNSEASLDPLVGLSVREIHDLCVIAGLPVNEIYISGGGYALRSYSNPGVEGVGRYRLRYGSIELQSYCLADIEVVGEFDRSSTSLSAAAYMQFLRESQGAGSSVDSWFLVDNVSVARRGSYQGGAVRPQTRIAAFDKLIPWDSEFSIKYPEYVYWRKDDSFQVYVPGGMDNCVLACLKWGLAKALYEDDVGFRPELTIGRIGVVKEVAVEYVEKAFALFKQLKVNSRINASPSTIQQLGYQAARLKFEKEFNKKVGVGFSPVYLKEFTKFLLESKTIHPEVKPVYLLMNRFKDEKTKKGPFFTDEEVDRIMINTHQLDPERVKKEENCFYRVFLIEAYLDGSFFPVEELADSALTNRTSESSSITHAICVHNPIAPALMLISFESFKTKVKEVFQSFLKYASSKCFDNDSAEKVPELLNEQNRRRELILSQIQSKDKRLIEYLEEAEVEGEYQVSNIEEEEVFVINPETTERGKFRVGVVIYDTETVDNLRGLQDRVYEPLRKYPPEGLSREQAAWYESNSPSQIPYVVQWGLMPKEEEEECLQLNTPPIPRESVRLCWGKNQLLGECVNDFLEELAELSDRMGYKKLFAYAHNGCGFDAYLMKAYNTKYPVKDILVTPRGILSLSIQLSKGSEVIFRDTKVFFAASLAELCQVFAVPAEYQKTDFPITRIHARNCYNPEVKQQAIEYMENDVICLSYVVKAINKVIKELAAMGKEKMGMGKLLYTSNPLYGEDIPPIAQFATLMSLVTRFQKQLFYKKYSIPTPIPVDLPALRKWVSYGNVGGRTTAYWRGFFSYYAFSIMNEYMKNKKNSEKGRSNYHEEMKQKRSGCQVWDATSLYPYAMFDYPMPTVSTEPIQLWNRDKCNSVIREIHCDECEDGWRLCEKHKCGGDKDRNSLGFGFIFLQNVKCAAKDGLAVNLCPRKLLAGGLVYSFESNEQLRDYHDDCFKSPPQFPEVQCYTMYDVYWLIGCGFTFDVMFGIAFPTSYVFREYTHTLFQMRIEAKKMEKENNLPKSLSTFYKLIYNGGYGINAKKDITDRLMITKQQENPETESKLRADRKISPDERLVRNTHSHELPTKQWILKIELMEGACRTYAPQSPNPIGAAVTACSRHHMNLAMYRLAVLGLVGYTDTDSMAIHMKGVEDCFRGTKAERDGMYNESSEAPLGTYKNDHESGKEETVFLSLFVAKKVKLHLTIDALGKIRVYPTFKGYNPSRVDYETGAHVPLWMLEKRKAQAIVRAYFDGYLEEMSQTEFKRDLRGGITIDRQAKFSASMEAFTGSCGVGTKMSFVPLKSKATEEVDFIEELVPHGSSREEIDLIDFSFFQNPHAPKVSEVQMDKDREGEICKRTRGICKDFLLNFLDVYYKTEFGDVREPGDDSNRGVSLEDEALELLFSKGTENIREEDYEWSESSFTEVMEE